MCYHLWSPGCSRNCRLTRSCATVRGVINILVDQATYHGKGNSAQPCVPIRSPPEGHRETMNKKCPRVYLNGLKCAHCSVPVFHPGAQRCKLQVKGNHSCSGSMSAQHVHLIVLSSNLNVHEQGTTAHPAVFQRTRKGVGQFIRIQ